MSACDELKKEFVSLEACQRLEAVGKEEYLSGKNLKVFLQFFNGRFPEKVRSYHVDEYYASVWAARFKLGGSSVWGPADSLSKKELRKLKYPGDIDV